MKSISYYRGDDLIKPESKDYKMFIIVQVDRETGEVEDVPYPNLNHQELLDVLETVYQRSDIRLPLVESNGEANQTSFVSGLERYILLAKIDIKGYEKDKQLYEEALKKRQDDLFEALAQEHKGTKGVFYDIHEATYKKAAQNTDDVETIIERYKDLIEFAMEIYLCDKEINCG